ncbi:MAG: hypothetical protein JWN40_267 [Phycisphaerales bacterium]|nr:hypothetical protein [Phycisphaerales bacterium]
MSVKRKWFLRILLGVVVLVLLLLLAVQVVLWTELPKNWVLGAIQEKLQLRVGTQQLGTGWSGRTSLSGVTLSLPLAEEAFLQTPRLTVEHTGLLALILGRPLRVESITIERPNLLVRQQADGRWNLEEVTELIRRAGGGKTADTQGQPKTASGAPQLPRVSVRDAVVRLVDVRGRQATVSLLNIEGQPEGPLVWKYKASIPDRLEVAGEIAPGADWQHEASVRLNNLGPWVRPFLSNPSIATIETLERFKLDGRWNGRVEGSLKGRLDLRTLFVGGYTATGPVTIAFDQGGAVGAGGGGVTMVSAAGVTITSPFKEQIPEGRIEGGTIALDGKSVSAKDLSLAFAGGELRLGGGYAWSSGDGKVEASWNNLILPKGAVHGGSLTASLRQPWPNQPVIDVTLNSNGHRGGDSWDARLTLAGAGRAWDQIDWKLTAPALAYRTPGQAYTLDQLQATLSTRGNLLTLDSLSIPPGELYGKWRRGTLAAKGNYHLVQGDWNVYLAGTDWPVAIGAAGQTPARFTISAYGDRAWARLEELFVDGAGVRVWANGNLSYRAPGMPVELNVYGWYPPLDYTWREQGGVTSEEVKLSGMLTSELHLTKAAWPVDLKIDGALYAKDFRMKGHPLGDVAMKLEGSAGPEHVSVGTSRLEFLSGVWGLNGDYRYDNRMTKLEVTLQELSLAQLDNFVGPPPNVRGTVSGRWNVHLPAFDVNRMRVEGEYSIHDLARFNPPPPTTSPAVAAALDKPAGTRPVSTNPAAQTVTAPALPATPAAYALATAPTTTTTTTTTTRATTAPTTRASATPIADIITGKVAVARGTVTLDPILAKRKDGETRALVSFPVNAPRRMHVEATTAAWPLEFADSDTHETSNVLFWAQTKGLDIDLKQLTATGPLNVQATIARNNRTVASVDIASTIAGRRLDLKSIKGEGLGGKIAGDGYLYLDDPLQSAGRVEWENIDAESVIALAPFTRGLVGRYTGSVRFSPTDPKTDPQATGPFAIGGTIKSAGGAWHGMQIGDAAFTAHADYRRAVLDHLDWNLAGGTLKGWMRYTNYGDEPFLHVNLAFDKLNLDQIVGAARPAGQAHKPLPGLLSGTAVAAGNPFSVERRKEASGDIRVRVTDSDLANVPVVNVLYSLLSVKLGPPLPTGRGFAEARLEGERLEIPVIRYFNRGVDIWASAAVLNIFKGVDSPIEGTAAGSARPLKDLKLPFMADVDQILGALQGAVATASIQGTLKDPQPKVIPFAQTGEAFRRFMVGEVKNEVRGTAGR